MEYEPLKELLAIPMRPSGWVRRMAYLLFELGFLRVRHVKRQLSKIFRVLPPNAHILDAGYGFGPYTDQALREIPDVRVTGYDVNVQQVQDCISFFTGEGFGDRCNFKELDLNDLKDKNTYDLAIAVDIMEHIEDDIKVLKNLRRALKKGGILLIHTPASEVDSRTVSHHDSFVGEHVRDGYHPDELREKLLESGFSRAEVRFTYGRWGMVSWWMMQGIPFRLLSISKFFVLLLPLYYLFVFPFAHRFMLADLNLDHLKGGGLIAKAWV